MRALSGAFSLLTRFPARGTPEPASAAWFFLPALCVGALSAFAFWATSFLRVPYFAALCFVMTEILSTGALHVDGFADVCDAFLCPASPERRVEIMHDSRLGTFGVLGLAFDVGARILLAGSLAPAPRVLAALAATPLAGKSSLLACLLTSRAAPGSEMGRGLIGKVGKGTGAAAVLAVFACVFLLAGPRLGLFGIASSFAVGLVMTRVARKNVGGSSGDVLGAANELGEIAYLVIAAGLLS